MEYENQSITFDALVNTFLNIKNFCLACLTAKLCALCAKNVLTCQHALHVYVLMCPRVLRAYMPTCFEYLCALGKNLGKCTMYIGIEFIPRLVLLFHFHRF